MTAAYRLKSVGWMGACVAIILGFYLISLQVAAERKALDDVNARIRTAQRDIRALETEFDTRANLAQLERWNGDTLALTAPVAGQFVGDEAALAAIDLRGVPATTPGATGGAVMTAALLVPSLPVLTPAQTTPAPADMAIVRVAAVTPLKGVAALKGLDAMPARLAVAPAVEAKRTDRARATAAVARVRPQAVAMLDRKLLADTSLLSPSTMGDILASARTEAGRRR